MAEKVAQFRLAKFEIIKSLIETTENVAVSDELNVEFKQESAVNEENRILKYKFETVISDKDKALNIDVITIGTFEFDKDLPEEMKANFFKVNAPAILFPYIRAHVTTLTSLSGIKPIILPTINIAARN